MRCSNNGSFVIISLLLVLGGGCVVFLLNGGHETLHLVLLRDRTMLKSLGTVDTNGSIHLAGENDWCRLTELDNSSWGVVRGSVWKSVKVWWQDGGKVILEVPNLNTTVIGDTSEDGGGEWGPADVIDLLLERLDLPAGHLWIAVLLMPDFDSPIVGAGQEDWAVLWMPEWVATHPVDGTLMTEIPVGVSLTKGRGALVH